MRTKVSSSKGDRPVVFASFAGTRPTGALARAAALATRCGTSLSVLLVTWDDAFEMPSGDSDEAWYETTLPRQLARAYRHRIGHVVHEAIEHVHACGARIVVLPAEITRSGTCVAAIAASAGVPVLVAHEPRAGDAIVAATDLRDLRYPIIQQAADMIEHQETTLVGIHNIEDTITEIELARRHAALATALDPISIRHEPVIDHANDPADAVLAAARERDADLVVVGVPRRSWLHVVLHSTVAARVVANARRSVLLAPLDRPASTDREN